jgi:carboxyl-terminal processing protease
VRRNPVLPILAAVACVIVLLGLGIYLGGHPDRLPDPVRSALVGDDESQLFQEAVDKVHADYYREVPDAELTDTAIAGMVDALKDKYSHYFTPKQFEQYMRDTNAQFTGVGIGVAEDPKGLKVVHIYDDSPAQKAGLKKDDLIIAAGGHDLAGLTVDRASNFVRGPIGSKVELVIQRGDEKLTKEVERAVVTAPVVASRMRTAKDGTKIAQVALAQFARGASEQVRKAVDQRLKQGAMGILLDLRGNGGGLVDEARLVASIFIPEGKIVTIKARNEPSHTLTATGDAISSKIPIAVLVDGNTASASEIVSGAIQDHDRGEIIGQHTYGKGVFQEVQRLSNGGALDLTVGEYFLPSGRNLGAGGVKQGAGVQPDIKAADDDKTKQDDVLQKGVQVLAGQAR